MDIVIAAALSQLFNTASDTLARTMNSSDKNIRGLVAKLLLTGVGMFVFAVFLMPPLYDVFCEITGLNGKTDGLYTGSVNPVDSKRTIKVQFIANNNESMPWRFEPMQTEVRVHPGVETQISYFAKNSTQKDMVGQAIPSLVPFAATDYFHKTECFCFSNQPLAAGNDAELVLRFIVDADIPAHIHTLTLAYTIFDITDYSNSKPKTSATQAEVTGTNTTDADELEISYTGDLLSI